VISVTPVSSTVSACVCSDEVKELEKLIAAAEASLA